ncbi:MAG: alpha-2-macroglobulin family protein [Moheibacter sp.]
MKSFIKILFILFIGTPFSLYSQIDSIQNEIKNIVYFTHYEQNENLLENDIILVLRDKVNTAKGLRKAMYRYYLAEIYRSYIDEYFIQIKHTDITPLEQLQEDYKTWTLNDFYREIDQLYSAALKDEELLKNEKTKLWNILIDDVDYAKYKPTLYNIVVDAYLQFLQELPFDFKNNSNEKSEHLKTKLLQFHSKDQDKTALLYLKSTTLKGSPKEQIMALESLADSHHSEPFSAFLLYQASNLMLSEKSDDNLKKAQQLCQKAINDIKPSHWNNYCKKTINELESKDLHIKIFNRNLPKEYIPITVQHKNTDNLKIEIFKNSKAIDFNKDVKWNPYSEENRMLAKRHIGYLEPRSFKTLNFKLPTFDDYKTHQTTLAIPPLEEGIYSLSIKSNEDEDKFDIVVTDLYYIKRFEDNYKVTFQAINTKIGKSIANTDYIMYQNINDYENEYNTERKNILVKTGNGTTDKNGMFSLAKSKEREYNNSIIYFPILKKYFVIDSDYNRMTDKDALYEQEHKESILKNFIIYTDRAIYRPGQKIFYKGILKQEFYEKTKVLAKQRVAIILMDNNYKEITKTEAVTNEFGSIFGEFTLPIGGTVGTYYITMTSDLGSNQNTASSYTQFKVEEYKRPKFQVFINPIKKAYKLGDSVEINGKAESFSGVNIANATVKYEIKRKRVYTWRSYYDHYYSPYNNEGDSKIANGETTTDSEGNFEIDFSTETNQSINEKRSYQYDISIYITDINGESQSNNTTITVGDLKAKIELSIAEQMLQNEWGSLKISVSNLNNQKIEAKGKITITQLIDEEKILLPKYNILDYNTLGNNLHYQYYNKDIFDSYFPHIGYHLPDTKQKRGKIIYSNTFDTTNSQNITLTQNPKPGKYLIEAETLIDNDTIKNYKLVEILDNITFQNGVPSFLEIRTNKLSYKVGETVTTTFLTDFSEGFVNYRLIRNNHADNYQQIAMKDGKAVISFITTDSDLKQGAQLEFDFIHDSDYYQGGLAFDIKENTDKKLDITTQVFRDKIQPGTPEKWTFTIKGKDKINAEVLATMYDAALDKFAKNTYIFNYHTPQKKHSYNHYDYYYNSTKDFLNDLIQFDQYYLHHNSNVFNLNSQTDFPKIKTPKFQYTNINNLKIKKSYDEVLLDSKMLQSSVGKINIRTYESSIEKKTTPIFIVDGKIADKNLPHNEIADTYFLTPQQAGAIYGSVASAGAYIVTSKKAKQIELLNNVKARSNLDETAFFFPNLYTNENGDVQLEFTSPEALTQWKLLLFAHTKDLKTGSAEFLTRTQKQLMVTPNPPRFLRQGDEVLISARIDNLSNEKISGDALFYLFDPETSKPLDSIFINNDNLNKIEIDANSSIETSWKIKIPYNINSVGYKVLVNSTNFSDGESNTLPILTDRLLVTETIPISIKEGQTKAYEMASITSPTSTSAINFNLSIELTANPLWFAVMSIPYLQTFPHECSEQLFSRLYGNILSTHIMNSSPKIKKVFDEWNNKNIPLNSLETNEELKNILIAETPWLNHIEDNDKQMQELALFFNLNKMTRDLKKSQRDLVKRQNPDGSFPWFPGGNRNKTISGHILGGFGKLKIILKKQSNNYFTSGINTVIKNTINYLDNEYYTKLIESKKQTDYLDISDYSSYFYYRSFWTDKKEIPSELQKVLNTLIKKYINDFDEYNLYHQAMITTFLHRYGYKEQAESMITKLKGKATITQENGMYWKDNIEGWYWHQSPIETQAILIAAFAEVTPKDVKSVEEMKIWLLKNKQTESWGTTKATTEAVFALLNYGKSWVDAEKGITMTLGNETIYPLKDENKISEAGFFKTSYFGKNITPEKGKLKINKTSLGIAWGGMYRLYYENIDHITNNNNSDVNIEKKLFVKTFQGNEVKLSEISYKNPIKTGDLITVRIIVKTNKNMQYIHLKDMRASGFEPVNVLSSYKWQNGIGYYEKTKDIATHFFFDNLPKGTYVFEYDLKANNAGDFSNGITTFQNMYAPAMSANSKGTRVQIER